LVPYHGCRRRIAEPDGAANGSQPFSSGDKSNVIGGWLPSLTFAFGGIAMNSGNKPVSTVVVAIIALVLAEALTFYGYSLLFLAEGQPGHHGDPKLNAWAWVCLSAMVVEPLAVFCWIAWAYKKRHAGRQPGEDSIL
jgi:hypothetical protein